MVGAIDESLKDWLILRSVEKEIYSAEKEGRRFNLSQASYAIAITFVGSLNPGVGDLYGTISSQILKASQNDARIKLNQLYAHQTSFGMQVGSPVVFYLGSYIYAVFDASSKLGDSDTAHAISFGLWYGVIVLAAICSCAMLGIGNLIMIKSIFNPQDQVQYRPTAMLEETHYCASFLWDRAIYHRMWTQGNEDRNVSLQVK